MRSSAAAGHLSRLVDRPDVRCVDELDGVLEQVAVEVLHLLLAELDLFEHGAHLVEREVPAFHPELGELPELFDVRKRDIDCQHSKASTHCPFLAARMQRPRPTLPSLPSPSANPTSRGPHS